MFSTAYEFLIVHMDIHSIFDQQTSTFTYIVHQGRGSECAVIDSVLDYNPKSARISYEHADLVITYVKAHALKLSWIFETHAHADHLSAAAYLQEQLGGKIAIGANIGVVQKVFHSVFHLPEAFQCDGSQFDYLLKDGEVINVGALQVKAIAVPGHTPACMAYQFEDALFVGDTLFMPDTGTARCDFPGGDAHALYCSIKKLLSFPETTRIFLCHDYPPNDRTIQFLTTVGEQRSSNIHIHDGVDEQSFVTMRNERDAILEAPALILPSIQVNIRAGHLPEAEANGKQYLKIPLNVI